VEILDFLPNHIDGDPGDLHAPRFSTHSGVSPVRESDLFRHRRQVD